MTHLFVNPDLKIIESFESCFTGYPKDMAEKMVGNKFWMKIRDMAFDKDGKEGKPKICCHFNIEAQ